MLEMLISDIRKLNRTWIPWLLILAPFAFCGLQIANYMIRLELLHPLGWKGLVAWTNYFWPVTLILGITLLASMLSGMEHDAKAWTKIFILPINKTIPFFSKFQLLFVSMMIFVFLTYTGLIIIGNRFDLGPTAGMLVAQQLLYPFFASMPVMVLQFWLSMTIQNQAVPITIGVVGATLSLFLAYSPLPVLNLLPWAYIPLASPLQEGNVAQWPLIGVLLGCFLLIASGRHFAKREF
ncbi:ABC transporter permease [Melghirimyces algeriensis]|uniref:ABC-2 type transport system permease protein n=1 Tax=Melghirimyces algeriensis TaxID=910412 RepID=A0A521BFC5_9BACL|nr:ABC transporter permease [Melghirimyces algeriensis]SMO45420.1 hypothetical protein SAMN06264849_10232 [Melghirimyces algeriensis]